MDRAGKFGYGFCFFGISMPYLIEKYLGRDIAFASSLVFVALGLCFLVAGHRHKTSPKSEASAEGSSPALGCLVPVLFWVFMMAIASPHGQRLCHQGAEWFRRVWN
jgi:hypothetical protein